MNRTILEKIAQIKSLVIIFLLAVKQPNKPLTHNTSNKLQRLEPTTLPKEISFIPFIDAVTLTAASGALVPKATIVNPMINDGIPSDLATLEHPSTNQSAHLINKINPITSKIILSICSLLP